MNLTGQQVYQKGSRRKRSKVSDAKYCAFLRTQRSPFSGKYPTVAAHFRTAANSGTGIKPPFSAIPLTQKEHDEQHRVGTFKFAGRDWWIGQVARFQDLFIRYGGEIPEKYRVYSQ